MKFPDKNFTNLTDKENIGLHALANAIGKDFVMQHKDSVFSTEETHEGLYCFFAIDLHPGIRPLALDDFSNHDPEIPNELQTMEEWDVYATCVVKEDGDVVLGKCKLPEQNENY